MNIARLVPLSVFLNLRNILLYFKAFWYSIIPDQIFMLNFMERFGNIKEHDFYLKAVIKAAIAYIDTYVKLAFKWFKSFWK